MQTNLLNEFEKIYHKKPVNKYFSPGRVNLIGEHIDYNGGLVLPCAITFGTYLIIAPNNDGKFRFKSLNFSDSLEISIETSYEKSGEFWFNYPLGIINSFIKNGCQIGGLDMLFYGDIPIGSGLSSSASIEVVTAFALNKINLFDYEKLDLVKLSKSVENDFIGVNCGIMDQFAVAFGEKNKALMLNCNTLNYEAVEVNLGDSFLTIINTNKPRKLAGSKYNERVIECGTVLKALQNELKIEYLCDIDAQVFSQYSYLIKDEVILKRARHVIEENDRVKLAAKALRENNLVEFGKLMYASHTSLQDLYEVSGIELDTIVEYCKADNNVVGARMTGAGFGGCAIAIVKQSAFNDFQDKISNYYTNIIGYAPSVYHSLIGNGVGELTL